jgi:hypothetical protein
MHYTIEKLLKGDPSVARDFAAANAIWPELFEFMKDANVIDWAQWLTNKQYQFESQCGGRSDGQEVMAWSGFAYLYSTQVGFEDNYMLADKLREAFERSMVSIEVKGAAKRAAASYLD